MTQAQVIEVLIASFVQSFVTFIIGLVVGAIAWSYIERALWFRKLRKGSEQPRTVWIEARGGNTITEDGRAR